jgi:uncharacterized membrane protein YkvI
MCCSRPPVRYTLVLAFIGSIVGFKELIAILFPICGYIGFLAMLGISLHFLSLQKKNNVDVREREFNNN